MIRFADLATPSWRLFILLVWATWWGGIFFYASVVVPIGTEAIGSVEQGFLTQKVSRIHNGLSFAFLACLVIESVRLRSISVGVLSATLAANVLFQTFWHARLTSNMNFAEHSVPTTFYQQHAVYLWLFAVEWIQGMMISAMLFLSVSQCAPRQGAPLQVIGKKSK